MKLTVRFFLILLGIAVVPLLLSVAWNINQYNSSVSSYYDLHKGISSLSAVNVEEWAIGVKKNLAAIYEIDSSPDKTGDLSAIRQVARINSDVASLSVLAKDGRELFFAQNPAVGAGRHLASYQAELVKKAGKSRTASGGEVLCLDSHAYYPMACPLADGRLVVLHVSMDNLLEKINSQQIGMTGKVILTDAMGRPLPCQKSSATSLVPEELRRIFRSGGGTGRLDAIKIGARAYSGAYTFISQFDWAALSVQADDEVYGRQRKSIVVFLFFALVVFLITLFVVFLISNRIIVPINNMVVGVKGFLKNKHLEKIIPQEGWPEIKVLGGVLNRLMLELQAYRAFQLNQILEERNKAQALIDTIPDGVLLSDEQGGIIYSNQTALSLFGIPKLSAGIVIPRSIKTEAFHAEFAKLAESDEKFYRAEMEAPILTTSVPVQKHFRIISNQFMLATLKRPGRVTIIRDISHEKELEKAKEDFFHMITHDMRAPLATIQGYAELLMKKFPPSPTTDKYFKSVLYSSRRLRGMIDDILNTTKLERGTMTLELEKISAGELMAGVRENHEPVAGPKDIKVSVLPLSAPVVFYGDNLLLERVLTNIVGNALKFTHSGGSITLSCSETEDEVRFSVRDTGPGIPEDKQKMIFEKYSQLEEHARQGFGLGLTMCRMTVELHKGKIWVESEVGKGSDFIFTISKKIAPGAKP